MLTKNLPIERAQIKADAATRQFTGYASVFNGVDAVGDTIHPGAYKNTLESRERPIQLRWNHTGPVIGKWLDLKEDATGLLVTGELTKGHSRAEDAYASLIHGSVDSLSIGYRAKAAEEIDTGRLLKEIELVEISIVESPADIGAKIGDVKSLVSDMDSLKEFEALLRDAAGFSISEAKAFVSGLKALCLRDGEAQNLAARETRAAANDLHNLLSTLKGDSS